MGFFSGISFKAPLGDPLGLYKKDSGAEAPTPPAYGQSMEDVLNAQIKLAPQLYSVEAQYQPLYNQLQAQQQAYLTQQAMDQARAMYPQVADIEAQYTAANKANELRQLQASLPEYQKAFYGLTPGYAEGISATGQLAQQAMGNALNQPGLSAYEENVGGPQMRSNLGRINQGLVNQYVGSMPGMGDYANYLAKISRAELEAGRSLTPEEQRIADQAARSAYAARGTALGNRAINAEILNRSELSNQRYQQRLANAANATGQIQSIYTPALNQAYQRQSDIQNFGSQQQQVAFQQAMARNQAQQQRLGFAPQLQAQYAQLGSGALGQLQQAQAPVLQAFYQQPILQGQVQAAQAMGAGMQGMSGPSLFNPESPTGMSSIYGAYNTQTQQAMGNAQAKAATTAGKYKAAGQLVGTLASAYFCWVAREVYGESNPSWLMFREWMLEEAPVWLRNAYTKYGEKIAEFIKDKPTLKNIIRRWMDSKIF